MMWFYIAGFISGAVGTVLFMRFLAERAEGRENDD